MRPLKRRAYANDEDVIATRQPDRVYIEAANAWLDARF
jgi:hypothetical protein